MTFWADARVAELRRLAPDYTAGQIAHEWDVTRNVICGKMARLGLIRPRPLVLLRRAPRSKRQAASSGAALKAIKSRVEWSPAMPCQPLPEAVREPTPETAVGLADLTKNACRWPLWGEATPSSDRLYCGGGAVEGLPYCHSHCQIAYTGQERATLPMRRAG